MTGRGESGAATVVAIALLGVLVTVTVAVGGGVGVVAGHRRAQAAADLAALAGATTLQDGGDGCAHAAHIAARNAARLASCEVDGWSVTLTVVTSVHVPGGEITLGARGRAGPVGES